MTTEQFCPHCSIAKNLHTPKGDCVAYRTKGMPRRLYPYLMPHYLIYHPTNIAIRDVGGYGRPKRVHISAPVLKRFDREQVIPFLAISARESRREAREVWKKYVQDPDEILDEISFEQNYPLK